MKRDVAIIGTVGVPASYGGFETMAEQLIKNWRTQFSVQVYCSGIHYKKGNRQKYFKRARLFYIPLKANGWQSVIYDAISIVHALFTAQTLLILGVSGCWVLPFVRVFSSSKVIVHIDGLEWRRDKWGVFAKRYLKLSEWIGVKYSDIDIADNLGLLEYTCSMYNTVSRCITYGGDQQNKVSYKLRDIEKYPFLCRSYAFGVCRIEPENNIHLILRAFEKCRTKYLVFVGNWKASKYGKDLFERYSNLHNITLLDPIYDTLELNKIRSNAYLYLHGHSAGGTNPSLVEAMHLGLPILAFDVVYNRVTTDNKAVYFKSEKGLSFLLDYLEYEDLSEISQSMEAIAHQKYKWHIIAKEYVHLIFEVQNNYKKSGVDDLVNQFANSTILRNNFGHLKYQHFRKSLKREVVWR